MLCNLASFKSFYFIVSLKITIVYNDNNSNNNNLSLLWYLNTCYCLSSAYYSCLQIAKCLESGLRHLYVKGHVGLGRVKFINRTSKRGNV